MKKNSFISNTIKIIKSKISIVAFILFAVTMQGCEKQQTSSSKNKETASLSSSSISSITKQQALDRLNEDFENEFSTIKMQQVYGVSKQQFKQWLGNSYMADTKDLYLSPIFSTNGNEYVIIKNVTVKETGKVASIGLIAVTPQFYMQYTRMVAVVVYNDMVVGIKHICSWRKCDSYEPCPCINWIDMVVGECPTDRCIVNEDCAHFQATDCNGELTGITAIDVLGAF